MKDIKSIGSIKDGVFVHNNENAYRQRLKDEGNKEHLLLTITELTKRTPDQNAYAFATFQKIADRVNQDGWDFEAYDIYKRVENRYCGAFAKNEKTGQIAEYVEPLKSKSPERFWQIIESARIDYMEKLDIYLQTPAEFYGLKEDAYDLWKTGAISFFEAKKMSDK